MNIIPLCWKSNAIHWPFYMFLYFLSLYLVNWYFIWIPLRIDCQVGCLSVHCVLTITPQTFRFLLLHERDRIDVNTATFDIFPQQLSYKNIYSFFFQIFLIYFCSVIFTDTKQEPSLFFNNCQMLTRSKHTARHFLYCRF